MEMKHKETPNMLSKHISATKNSSSQQQRLYKSQMKTLVTDFSLKMHCSVILIANHTLFTFKNVKSSPHAESWDANRSLQCASPRVSLRSHVYKLNFNLLI